MWAWLKGAGSITETSKGHLYIPALSYTASSLMHMKLLALLIGNYLTVAWKCCVHTFVYLADWLVVLSTEIAVTVCLLSCLLFRCWYSQVWNFSTAPGSIIWTNDLYHFHLICWYVKAEQSLADTISPPPPHPPCDISTWNLSYDVKAHRCT